MASIGLFFHIINVLFRAYAQVHIKPRELLKLAFFFAKKREVLTVEVLRQ